MDMISTEQRAAELCRKAAGFLKDGRPGVARPLLAAVQALSPRHPDLGPQLARLAVTEGDVPGALATLDTVLAADPADLVSKRRRAELRYRLGDRVGAALDAADVVSLAPADIEGKAMLGTVLLDLGRVDDAIICLKAAVAAAPANPAPRETLARALEPRDPDAALQVLLDGLDHAAAVTLTNAAMRLAKRRDDLPLLIRLGEQARSAGTADATTFTLLGEALRDLHRPGEAAWSFRDALKLQPRDPMLTQLAETCEAAETASLTQAAPVMS